MQRNTPTTAGILVCSVGVLMQEILLTRIFSFTIWYHLAYLTISTALLGFGAAGSLLALNPRWIERAPERFAALTATAAGASLLVAMALLGPNPLLPEQLLTSPASFGLTLLGYYAVVSMPFLFAGLAVATPLSAYPDRVNRLYAADLLGAALGCVAAVLALQTVDGAQAVFLCAAVFVAAGACYAAPSRLAAGLAAAAAALVLALPIAGSLVRFTPTPTKSLGVAQASGVLETLYTRWSPVNRVDLFHNYQVGGFWHTFGVSPQYDGTPPRVASIVYDAHNGSDIPEIRGRESLSVLDHHILSVPYLLFEKPDVLVIGVGGGIDVFNALYHGANRVTGVDLQPITVGLHQGMLAEWTGGWMQRPEVELVGAEGRHYIRSHDATHDIIQITAVDTFSAQTTGAYVLAESYLYTVEAFLDYFSRLNDDGVLSIGIGDLLYDDRSVPTPFSMRLALVAREALSRRGVDDPAPHVLLVGQGIRNPKDQEGIVRGGWIQELLVRKRPFTPEEIARVRDYADSNGFTVRLAPSGEHDPHLGRIVYAPAAELSDRLDEQIFRLDPITDDRPFFFNVLRWSQLVLDDRIEFTNPGSVTGQLVLLMMLGQALVLGAVLVVLPVLRLEAGSLPRGATLGFGIYFLSLGIGFLLIEISFVQKYVLLLGYPTYSLSVTICSLLVAASFGAALSRRGFDAIERRLPMLLGMTIALVALEVLALPWIRERFLATPLGVRMAVTAGLQLPLGLVLGMYFPTGVELLRRMEPRLIPWAWAVNGVGSVMAAVLAVMLGMAIGFSGVAAVACGIYAVGLLGLRHAIRSAA